MMNDIQKQIEGIHLEIDTLGEKSNHLLKIAKSDVSKKEYYIQAANSYLDLVNAYKKYEPFILFFSDMQYALLQANLHHEQFDYALCQGRYCELSYNYVTALSFYIEAYDQVNIAVQFMEQVKNSSCLTNELVAAVQEDYHRWTVDCIELKGLIAYCQSHIALSASDYPTAYDQAHQAFVCCEQSLSYLHAHKNVFTSEDFRIRESSVQAMSANLFSINAMTSIIVYNVSPSLDQLQDILFFLLSSYKLTNKAIQSNNFWSHYKVVRQEIRDSIEHILKSEKAHWSLLLETEKNLPDLNFFMKAVDSKYYDKITRRKTHAIMNIFKNKIKTTGNVVINNGGENQTFQTDSHNTLIFSQNDKQTLTKLVEYIKQNQPNEISYSEHQRIITSLQNIANSTTPVAEDSSIKQWKKYLLSLSSSAIKFLSTSADLLAISDFIRELLNI